MGSALLDTRGYLLRPASPPGSQALSGSETSSSRRGAGLVVPLGHDREARRAGPPTARSRAAPSLSVGCNFSDQPASVYVTLGVAVVEVGRWCWSERSTSTSGSVPRSFRFHCVRQSKPRAIGQPRRRARPASRLSPCLMNAATSRPPCIRPVDGMASGTDARDPYRAACGQARAGVHLSCPAAGQAAWRGRPPCTGSAGRSSAPKRAASGDVQSRLAAEHRESSVETNNTALVLVTSSAPGASASAPTAASTPRR